MSPLLKRRGLRPRPRLTALKFPYVSLLPFVYRSACLTVFFQDKAQPPHNPKAAQASKGGARKETSQRLPEQVSASTSEWNAPTASDNLSSLD